MVTAISLVAVMMVVLVPISLAVAVLFVPTLVNSRADDGVEVVRRDTTDEKHFDVMLNRDQLGVVDPGLGRELFTVVEFQARRFEAELGLAINELWLSIHGKDDTVLRWLHAPLGTSSSLICQDRPVGTSQKGRAGGWESTARY